MIPAARTFLAPFHPAVLRSLAGYDRKRLVQDLLAGVVVGVVAIPLALAFAIASGVKPEAGLATAVVAGFLISALGGSRVQVGGPTGAFVVIVYGVIATHGIDGLAIATVMAGVILVAMGLFRVGRVIAFIPEPVITGFTAGIGAIIFVGQLKEILGLSALSLPADGLGKIQEIALHLGDARPWPIAVALATIGTILLIKRFVPRVPGPVVALVGFTAAVFVFRLPVETIGDRFGELPRGLHFTGLHGVTIERIQALIPSALTIALLGAIESLLSAVVADGLIDDKHDPDTELVAQGVANLASPIFGGIPATGAIARTATNVQNGASTPIAGITHAAVVLLAVTLLPGLLVHVPLAVLGGILVVVAWYMSDVPRLLRASRMPRADAAVLFATLALTVLVDLVVAVEVGMVLASLLFMLRMSQVGDVHAIEDEPDPDDTSPRQQPLAGKIVPEGVLAYSIDGPFFFGAAERFQGALARIKGFPRVVIFRMRHVPYIDSTGLSALGEIVRRFRKRGTVVIISAVQREPMRYMRRAGFMDVVGEENFAPDIDVALSRARRILAEGGGSRGADA